VRTATTIQVSRAVAVAGIVDRAPLLEEAVEGDETQTKAETVEGDATVVVEETAEVVEDEAGEVETKVGRDN